MMNCRLFSMLQNISNNVTDYRRYIDGLRFIKSRDHCATFRVHKTFFKFGNVVVRGSPSHQQILTNHVVLKMDPIDFTDLLTYSFKPL